PHLAVGEDVDAGRLHVANRQERRIVLRLLEIFRRHAPDFGRPHAWHLGAERGAVDEPVGLRIAADDRRGDHEGRDGTAVAAAPGMTRPPETPMKVLTLGLAIMLALATTACDRRPTTPPSPKTDNVSQAPQAGAGSSTTPANLGNPTSGEKQ